jgi:hypothetical protein
MKKKLVIGGCSWSDIEYVNLINSPKGVVPGQRYDGDIITIKNFPNWAQLLAKKLDMELVCLAKCGFGQQGIFSTIQDYVVSHDPKEIGLCIAAWSKSQRANWQKISLNWDDSKPNLYGHVHFWILDSLRYMYAFQTLMENNRIPYRHFQMISLFIDHLYEVEYKDNGIPFRKIYNSCCDVIKTSPYFHKMKNFIGWPIIDECGGFVLGDVQIHKNWGVENRLANNIPNSTFNPANSTYEERQKNSVSEERVHDKDTDMKLLNVEDDGRTLYKIAPKDLVNYDYVISKANTHPNKKGHEWLANYIKLYGFNSQRVQEKDKI